ncbi:putative lactoylglutathione lyase [Saccharothrix tamanrassetensis]|uniref:Putative lactoylglutathione lyase n=1 Tax=Saccharothrix tamanrassetensis TaxID=1051531 RepID=A0A841CL71_9PSEU|nr:VOC family protein [Saccharothrix tamanrassetensis]MBB5957114.1 putative lactoylglutathione lyase [Saccharothrix tamanrassetensis]
MSVKIFVNLPVADLAKSIEFFGTLGFKHNPEFTDENATCIVFGDTVYAMLLTKPYFKTFVTDREIVDSDKAVEAILALGVDSRAEVDEIVDKALAAGARSSKEPQDHGFMYSRGFADLDGHLWELFWMDESAQG